jgi:predicted phosphodiesterase
MKKSDLNLSRFLCLLIAVLVLVVMGIIGGCANGGVVDEPTSQGVVKGRIMDHANVDELPGATVTVGGVATTTDKEGYYGFAGLSPGVKPMIVTMEGFEPYSGMVDIPAGTITLEDIYLYPFGYAGEVKGIITDGNTKAPIAGVSVTIGEATVQTDSAGAYSFPHVTAGFSDILAEKDGYQPASANFTMVPDSAVMVNMIMYPGQPVATMKGIVKSSDKLSQIGGSTVKIGNTSTQSDYMGNYEQDTAPAGTQKIIVQANGYNTQKLTMDITPGESIDKDFFLVLMEGLVRKEPYLLLTGKNTSMIVRWQTYYTPEKSTIEWGSSKAYSQGPFIVGENSNAQDEHLFSYEIKDLSPASRVYYKVAVDGQSFEGSFLTLPDDSASKVTFYAYGDTRTMPYTHEKVIQAILADMNVDSFKERHTILLHGGDFVARGLTESFWDNEYFNPNTPSVAELLSMIPVLGVVGNHECYKEKIGAVDSDDFKDGGKLLRKYWPYPSYPKSDRFYHAVDFGPVRLMAVDNWVHPEYTSGTDQYEWLKHELETTRKTWKVVFMHTPIWSSTGASDEMIKHLVPLFKKHSVKVVLQGHSHYYSRCEVDGIQYLTVGGGGAPLTSPTPYNPKSAKYVKAAKQGYNFARIQVNGSDMKISVFDETNQVIDSVSLKK